VAPFPGPGGKRLVSTAGGNWPRWRGDGRELFYLSPDNQLMAASVNATGTAFEVGEVRSLFQTRPPVGKLGYAYDVTRDGQRFVINSYRDESGSAEPITVVVNWLQDLKK
jgi:eukaryotic-like serine/threonine-protein kinase